MKDEFKKKMIFPIVIKKSIDDLKPLEVFMKLFASNTSKKAFLFENNDKAHSAYSFLGVDPIETLKVKNGLVLLEKNNTATTLEGSPEKVLTEYLSTYSFEQQEGLPPFYGGVIGYISYDFVRYLEKITLPTIDLLEENETCLMLFKTIIAFDHVRNQLFIISNAFDDSKKAIQEATKEAELLEKTLDSIKSIPDVDTTKEATNLVINKSFGEENFIKAVKKVKKHIKDGDIFQCVLSERFSIDINVDSMDIYRALRQINPSPYLFYLSTGEEIILGSSPEMLVKVYDGKVNLCPIAGTRPRSQDAQEDKKLEKSLLRSVKEKAEHLMLVDLGRNDAGKVSQAGTVAVKQFMKVERFSSVMHLVSLVEGKLAPSKTTFDAFKGCFPAGTLSGAPKVRAMEIIAELEPVRRGIYGGAIFCHGFSDYLDSCIAIRSLYIKGNKGYIQAGAGIVADSNPKKEYEEILNKSKAVLRAVRIAHENHDSKGAI